MSELLLLLSTLIGMQINANSICLRGNSSGKTAHMFRLVIAFAGHLHDKHQSLMSWHAFIQIITES